MLNQDTASEQTSSFGAARERVTPEELTRALAAIEARKQAEANRLAGTIPLADAVSEMQLDSTPDEIWAEVQAQRTAASPPRPKFSPLRVQTPRRGGRFLRPFIPLLALWVLFQTGIIPHFWHHATAATAAPILRPLASVADGTEVFADSAALLQLSEGKPLTQILVSSGEIDNRWCLVKLGGHVYLRGYIANADSLPNIQGMPLNVYTEDNSGELEGEKTSNITLRVDNIPLQKSGGGEDYSEITVPNFHPDPLTTLSPWR